MKKIALLLIVGLLLVILLGTSVYAATGTIARINRPGTEGAIQDDNSCVLYQFQIPQDVAPGGTRIVETDVGRPVVFEVDKGRTATNVFKIG